MCCAVLCCGPQIVLAPVVRIVALALLWHYDGICLAHHTKAKKQA